MGLGGRRGRDAEPVKGGRSKGRLPRLCFTPKEGALPLGPSAPNPEREAAKGAEKGQGEALLLSAVLPPPRPPKEEAVRGDPLRAGTRRQTLFG